MATTSCISALLSVMFVFIFGTRNFLSRFIWNEKPAPNIWWQYMLQVAGPCIMGLNAGFTESPGFFTLKFQDLENPGN